MAWEHCDDGEGHPFWSAGDTAWILFATTFVMLQTPATGIAQAGLVRSKNALSIIAQAVVGVAIGSALWYMIGFSLTFGTSWGGFIGSPKNAFFLGIPLRDCFPMAPSIPALLYATYQMMFALMVPVIVTGAWAEKLRFHSFMVFCVLWPFFVYYPVAHWVWNTEGWLGKFGALDFAGGLTIHTTSGVAALVVTAMLEARSRHKQLKSEGSAHNIPLTVVGMSLTYAGWYAFNGGSAFKADIIASIALLNTQISACTALITWVILSYILYRNVPLTGAMSGVLAGLAGVTPASGFVDSQTAFVIGIIAACAAFATIKLLGRFHLDDVLDVFALQAVPGITGLIVTGFAARSEYAANVNGVIFGGDGRLLGAQLLGIVVVVPWTAFWTFVIFKALELLVGINVTADLEDEGLDTAEHGEKAYGGGWQDMDTELENTELVAKLCDAASRGSVPEVIKLLSRGASPWRGDYDDRTPLHLAAAGGYIQVMAILLKERGVDINAVDRFGSTPLQDALRAGQDKAVEWLKKNGGELRMDKLEGMMCDAASNNEIEKLRRLLEAGADPNVSDYDGRSGLHLAAAEGHQEAVKLLLSYGAKIDVQDRWGSTPLVDAMRYHHHHVVALLKGKKDEVEGVDGKEKGDGNFVFQEGGELQKTYAINAEESLLGAGSPSGGEYEVMTSSTRMLLFAASNGDLPEIIRLIKKGSDPSQGDYDERTPLHLAAAGGHLDCVKYLCSRKGVSINAMDRWHSTPLLEALKNKRKEVAEWLQQNGAINVNKDKGHLLCKAAALGDKKAIKRLLREGADINTGDYDARTAVHLASAEGKVDVLKWLIRRGGNVNTKDRWGGTPRQDAIRHKQAEADRILREAGAKDDFVIVTDEKTGKL